MKVVNCRDVGVDCDFVANGETLDELRQCGEHAARHMDMRICPPN